MVVACKIVYGNDYRLTNEERRRRVHHICNLITNYEYDKMPVDSKREVWNRARSDWFKYCDEFEYYEQTNEFTSKECRLYMYRIKRMNTSDVLAFIVLINSHNRRKVIPCFDIDLFNRFDIDHIEEIREAIKYFV